MIYDKNYKILKKYFINLSHDYEKVYLDHM